MLYEELKELTKGECTYDEYKVVNAAYTESDTIGTRNPRPTKTGHASLPSSPSLTGKRIE